MNAPTKFAAQERALPLSSAKESQMDPAPVFEQTYHSYLTQLADLDFFALQESLGVSCSGPQAVIPIFNKSCRVSADGVAYEDGTRPNLGVCVVLFKYLLMGSRPKSDARDLVTFKDFKDATPLVHFFDTVVKGAITRHYTGRSLDLAAGCERLGGSPCSADWAYQVKFKLTALPRIPLYLLFNDAEEGFGAQSTVLFQRNTETYLDMESVAMLGGELARLLQQF